MINENEVLTFLFGLGTLAFVVTHFSRLKQLPHARLFLGGFIMIVPGWTATIFEDLFWGELFDAIEHVAYAVAMTLLATWTILLSFPKNQRPPEGRNS